MVDRLVDILGEISERSIANNQGETFNYSEIVRLFKLFNVEIGANRLLIILDEWAQIPLEAQPYFAEFLKRAFFANTSITLKIGVVDYTYRLAQQQGGNLIGLEKSADIFSDIRMDTYFVWDEDRDFVENFF